MPDCRFKIGDGFLFFPWNIQVTGADFILNVEIFRAVKQKIKRIGKFIFFKKIR